MAKRSKIKIQDIKDTLRIQTEDRLKFSGILMLGAVAAYYLLALLSFHLEDPGWSQTGDVSKIINQAGTMGAWLASVSLSLIGYLSYLCALYFAFGAWLLTRRPVTHKNLFASIVRFSGFIISLLSGTSLAHLHGGRVLHLPEGAGGILGQQLGNFFNSLLGHMGATLLMLALFIAGITLWFSVSWLKFMDEIGRRVLQAFTKAKQWIEAQRERSIGKKAKANRSAAIKFQSQLQEKKQPIRIEPLVSKIKISERAKQEIQRPLFENLPGEASIPLSLLDDPKPSEGGYSPEALQAISRQVELKLADFGVVVSVVAANPGPVITRFELEPAPGVKSSQISNLAKDLARGLSVISVRVVDIIPGKSVIGLEIPNANREIVYLSEIIRSEVYDKKNSPLTLALGKDIGGNSVVTDLAKMPHLLVAGTTGSGKSVAVNSMILSLLYKASPDEVRIILIDPKMLELSVYEGIPHLLAPVVTDMKDAANALRWCVAEMESRYQLMAAVGVRNLAGYNRKIKDGKDKGKPLTDPLYVAPPGQEMEPRPELDPIPNIVVVVDEFADMMMIVGKKVEELITRLAQKARAAGIHLILATQRPSVDVITGLIKANIPTRIAFQVSSKIDSRTILDQSGAEQLLGHGDMLFLAPGSGFLERVHGAFVDDHEVHAVVKFLKSQGEPRYIDEVLQDMQFTTDGQVIGAGGLPESTGAEQDEYYDMAIKIVTESRRASISNVQRRLKVGYNRAARMIEEMEAAGIVSGPDGKGNRQVIAPPPPKD